MFVAIFFLKRFISVYWKVRFAERRGQDLLSTGSLLTWHHTPLYSRPYTEHWTFTGVGSQSQGVSLAVEWVTQFDILAESAWTSRSSDSKPNIWSHISLINQCSLYLLYSIPTPRNVLIPHNSFIPRNNPMTCVIAVSQMRKLKHRWAITCPIAIGCESLSLDFTKGFGSPGNNLGRKYGCHGYTGTQPNWALTYLQEFRQIHNCREHLENHPTSMEILFMVQETNIIQKIQISIRQRLEQRLVSTATDRGGLQHFKTHFRIAFVLACNVPSP